MAKHYLTLIRLKKRRKRRRDLIVAQYKNGISSTVIADKEGVSHQRIQQILSKEGIKKNEGGASLKSRLKKEKRLSAMDKNSRTRVGYSFIEYKNIRNLPGKPAIRYRKQRQNAKERGIGWDLTFRQWWEVWDTSGKWNERGKFRGQHVMARFNDKGPYKKDNVSIITCTQNIVDGYRYRGNNDERTTDGEVGEPQSQGKGVAGFRQGVLDLSDDR